MALVKIIQISNHQNKSSFVYKMDNTPYYTERYVNNEANRTLVFYKEIYTIVLNIFSELASL